jgi:N-acetylmuramoyl-L-alanine amidase
MGYLSNPGESEDLERGEYRAHIAQVRHLKRLFVALEEVRPWVVVPALERYPRC